jgi:hypothetical protein
MAVALAVPVEALAFGQPFRTLSAQSHQIAVHKSYGYGVLPHHTDHLSSFRTFCVDKVCKMLYLTL